MSLNVSIVRYEQSYEEIEQIIGLLKQTDCVSTIYLIDNSKNKDQLLERLNIEYSFNGNNLGFGAAHNIALRKSIENNAKYHLILNSDIIFAPVIWKNVIEYMDENQDVGALMPKVFYPDGRVQHLCKLLPTPADLFSRRFLPDMWTKRRMHTFELIDSMYDKVMNIPYLSGCCMMLRVDVLKDVGLFDERFFLYPEDLDLSRRIHQNYKTVFYPYVSIIHAHNRGSYTNVRLLWIHSVNMIRYFNKWGWFDDPERKKVNEEIINSLKQLVV